jgi:hypothetical protein
MGAEMSHFVLVKNLISDVVLKEKKERKNIKFYPLAAAGVFCVVFSGKADTEVNE